MPKIIPRTTFEQIKQDAEAVKKLGEKKYQFLTSYLNSAISQIEQMILNNTVKAVREEMTITETLKKVFFTPKQEQLDELRGRYKMLVELKEFLDSKVRQRDDLLKLVSSNKVKINEDK